MLRTILLSLLILMAVGPVATGQSILNAKRTSQTLLLHMKQLNVAADNLLQMEEAVKGTPESADIDPIMNAQSGVTNHASEVSTIAWILVNMKCPDDAQYVRGELRKSAQRNLEETDLDIKMTNFHLTNLRTPAIVAEVTKIRDLMVEMRNLLQQFTGQE